MKVIITGEVRVFLDILDISTAARTRKYVSLLEEFGHMLRMPYSRNILPGIFELRIVGRINVRLIYAFRDSEAIIFYGYIKKTEKIGILEMTRIKLRYRGLQI